MEYRPLYEEYFALMVEIGQHWEALSRVMLRDYWVLFYYSFILHWNNSLSKVLCQES